jgi:quercetin dioxygenase-like cupin family protein
MPIKTVLELEDVLVKHLVLAPGQEVPWHFHSAVRDMFYVVRGPLTIHTREPAEELVLEAGDTFQARASQPHRAFNASNHEVSAILIQGLGKYDFRKAPPPASDGSS